MTEQKLNKLEQQIIKLLELANKKTNQAEAIAAVGQGVTIPAVAVGPEIDGPVIPHAAFADWLDRQAGDRLAHHFHRWRIRAVAIVALAFATLRGTSGQRGGDDEG